MARPLDPWRTLELPRDATLDEVKAAYRRLAKRYHPDSAGEAALTRFLAVQAAYEALTEGPARLRLGLAGRTRRPAATQPAASRPARPTGGPARGSGGSGGAASRGSSGPGGTGGTAPRGSSGSGGPSGARPGSWTDAGTGPRTGSNSRSGTRGGPGGIGGTGRRGANRKRAKPGSTSYDDAQFEPFEPTWEGASWYGESSGTYWTLNPKEFADPRKHGPEYQARARSAARRRGRGPDAAGPAEDSPDEPAWTGDDASVPGSTPGHNQPRTDVRTPPRATDGVAGSADEERPSMAGWPSSGGWSAPGAMAPRGTAPDGTAPHGTAPGWNEPAGTASDWPASDWPASDWPAGSASPGRAQPGQMDSARSRGAFALRRSPGGVASGSRWASTSAADLVSLGLLALGVATLVFVLLGSPAIAGLQTTVAAGGLATIVAAAIVRSLASRRSPD